MSEVLQVVVAAAVAFVVGGVYYGALGDRLPVPEVPAPRWTYGVELLRCAMLAVVFVGVATSIGIAPWLAGPLLGLALWTGFPLVLWVGRSCTSGRRSGSPRSTPETG